MYTYVLASQLTVQNTAGWEDTVLWNPYGNEGMGYNNFVCVESVKVSNPLVYQTLLLQVLALMCSLISSHARSLTPSLLELENPGQEIWPWSLENSKCYTYL